ncbi:ABC1 kinase family protein [Corynebacterium guangdongense]|uniref:Ubiquinone biosynthesis protein n=1 Tax=Corynebacterium guangdongense TaxID=1783348 RepID=A0ABU1ZYG7_9CORY|nr:AarF/UbiB family protein [Corynebacterium guangdongense]MDR7329292.1 ubiquinone biosynthesis protein [Corynebacterium guangdongense]WJZ17858.1 putative protein kinase UbiB [Corynebacterium guangdongense]
MNFPALEGVGGVLLVIGAIVVAAAVTGVLTMVLAVVMRRLLGVPVGWPRTVAVAALVVLSTAGIFGATLWDLSVTVEGVFTGVNFGSTLLILAIATMWMLAFGSAALTILEILAPTGSLPNPLRVAVGMRGRRHRNRRYRQVISIFARHGLAVPFTRSRDSATEEVARRFRRALEEAGTTFVKLGQNLSTRSDVLPAAFTRELSKLQSDATPAPWPDIAQALQTELKDDPQRLFAWIDREPLAAASIAQIHRATLLDGTEVVLKIQRPGTRDEVMRDTDILVEICDWLDLNTPWGADIGIADLARSFSLSLREELDYRVEARNMEDMNRVLADGPVIAPTVYPEISTQRLLVMDYFDGVTVGRGLEVLAQLPAETRARLGEVLMTSVMRQVMESGIFHADIHPGNVILLQERRGWRLGLLDFGVVGRIDRGTQQNLTRIFAAIDTGDTGILSASVLDLVGRPTGFDEQDFNRQVGQMLAKYRSGLGGSLTGLVTEIMSVVADFRLAIPAPVAFAMRSLAGTEGTLNLIDPEVNIVELAKREGTATVKRWLRPGNLRDSVEATVIETIPMLRELPRNVNATLGDLHAGRLTINMRFFNDEGDRFFITRLLQQITLAVLSGFSILGGVVLMTFGESGPMVTTDMSFLQAVGFIVLFVGFILALRVVTAVIFRESDHTKAFLRR